MCQKLWFESSVMKLLCVVVLFFFVCLFGHNTPPHLPRPCPSGLGKQSSEKVFLLLLVTFFFKQRKCFHLFLVKRHNVKPVVFLQQHSYKILIQ